MGTRRDLQISGDLIRYSPKLHSWMLAYAEYLVSCSRLPTWTMRRVELARLAKRVIGLKQVKALEEREDFQKYLADLNKGPIAEARAKYLGRLPKYIDAYDKAVDQAIEAKDYKAVATMTEPAIDRVAPRKEPSGPTTQVAIVLSPERLAGFASYTPPAIEAETLDPPPAEQS